MKKTARNEADKIAAYEQGRAESAALARAILDKRPRLTLNHADDQIVMCAEEIDRDLVVVEALLQAILWRCTPDSRLDPFLEAIRETTEDAMRSVRGLRFEAEIREEFGRGAR